MNDLHMNGVEGIRVLIYGTTFDAPGRRELLAMQSYTAFYPCPHCLHTWQPGLRGQVYGGYRRYLPIGSRFRNRVFHFLGHTYMFRDFERRPPPPRRTNQNVAYMVSRARPRRPFCGHKSIPFMNEWIGVDWESELCDIMHDLKCLCERIMKILVGKGAYTMYKAWSWDSQHREDCEAYRIFEDYLDGTTRYGCSDNIYSIH